jgi:hypothetical protein
MVLPDGIRDVSTGGLRLLLDRPLAVGTRATLDAYNITREFPCRVELRVVWIREDFPCRFAHGCAFVRELSNLELWGLR